MLHKLGQVALFNNLPLWALVVFVCVMSFVVMKSILSFVQSRSLKSKFNTAITTDRNGNVKIINKKKRSKKQRSSEYSANQSYCEKNLYQNLFKLKKKLNSFSVVENSAAKLKELCNLARLQLGNFLNAKLELEHELNMKIDQARQKDERSTATQVNVVTHIPVSLESGDLTASQSEKKVEKKKAKSKKKKIQNIESVPVSVDTQSVVEEDGEWQTVRSKEHRAARREKKRQEISETPIITTYSKLSQAISSPSTYTSVSSMAKDIAPRFARAAGEEWQEGDNKRQALYSHKSTLPIVNRSPMVPASVLQTLPNWLSSNEGLWKENTAVPTSSHLSNISTPWPHTTPNKIKDFSMARPGVHFNSWSTKPSCYLQPWEESINFDQPKWTVSTKSDDLVHNSSPSSTRSGANDPWSSSVFVSGLPQWPDAQLAGYPSSFVVAQAPVKRGSIGTEQKNIPVTTLDADDPWNIDAFEKEGDWSPPEATWCNSNEEWKVPTVPSKPKPTYFVRGGKRVKLGQGESSEDDRVATTTTTVSHVVVGAGSKFLSSQNQTANKKSRRRRRKKHVVDSTGDAVCKETIVLRATAAAEEVKDAGILEACEEALDSEPWSVSKSSKKKKPRVRKAA